MISDVPQHQETHNHTLNSWQAHWAELSSLHWYDFAFLIFITSEPPLVHFPTGNSSASTGFHLWEKFFWLQQQQHWEEQLWSTSATWSRFFLLGPTENYATGSWKQPLCFLVAVSSLFSHVHLSNQCVNACQKRLLFNYLKPIILEHIFERNPNLLKITERLSERINTWGIKFWALPSLFNLLILAKSRKWIKFMSKIH